MNAGSTLRFLRGQEDLAEGAARKLETFRVAEVTLYHAGPPRYVNVRPLLRDQEGRDLPTIERVPILDWHWGPFSLSASPTVGDQVLLAFTRDPLDPWLEDGQRATPELEGTYALADAVVLGRLRPFSASHPHAEDGAAVLEGPNGIRLKLTGSGKVAIGNDTVELFDRLDAWLASLGTLLDNLIATTVATSLGTQYLSSAISGQLADRKADLVAIRAELAQLKE